MDDLLSSAAELVREGRIWWVNSGVPKPLLLGAIVLIVALVSAAPIIRALNARRKIELDAAHRARLLEERLNRERQRRVKGKTK